VSMRVLITDDHPDAAHALGLLFERAGMEVRACTNPAEALRQAVSFRPHAAVLDLNMPGVGGLDLARLLRAQHLEGPLLLVALTGDGTPEARERTAAAGFAAHLQKPVDGAALVRLVEGLYRDRTTA
jgi:two-component system CheB/CheR fusion protein